MGFPGEGNGRGQSPDGSMEACTSPERSCLPKAKLLFSASSLAQSQQTESSRRRQVGLWSTRRPRGLVQIYVQVVRHGTDESDVCEGVGGASV